ncbi:MAG: hypothetical protein AB7Q45_16440 [Planctomycetaceae bacterium]
MGVNRLSAELYDGRPQRATKATPAGANRPPLYATMIGGKAG